MLVNYMLQFINKVQPLRFKININTTDINNFWLFSFNNTVFTCSCNNKMQVYNRRSTDVKYKTWLFHQFARSRTLNRRRPKHQRSVDARLSLTATKMSPVFTRLNTGCNFYNQRLGT